MNARRPPPQEAPSKGSTPVDQVLGRLRPAMLTIMAFSLLANLLRLTLPLYMLQIFDRVLPSSNVDTLLYLSLIAVFALAAGGVLAAVIKVLQNRVGSWVEASLIEPVTTASLDGRLSARSMGVQPARDLGQVRNFIGSQGLTTLFDLPWVPVFIVVIWYLDSLLGVIALVSALVLLAMAILNDFVTRRAQENAQRLSGQFHDTLGRGVQGSETLHALGMSTSFVNGAVAKSDVARADQDAVNERGGMVQAASRAARQIAQIAMYGGGAYLAVEGEITTGLVVAGSILLNLALTPLDQTMMTLRGVMSVREAIDRLRRQLGVSDQKAALGRMVLSVPTGHLSVDKALYMPPGKARPIIKPTTFDVAPGEMVGIIGPAGSGKSVLCKMLVGLLQPQGGSVQLDRIDVYELVTGELGRHVAYVSQSPVFFPGTVEDNIGRLDAPGSQRSLAVRQAAEMMQIHAVISAFPQGYETDLQQVLPNLSRSEQQRLVLARAFYGDPQLIVLDEPAESLDRAGEAALVDALREAKERGCTIAVVSQRPALMRLCDRLLLFRDGVMESVGEPEKVLAQLRDSDNRRSLWVANG